MEELGVILGVLLVAGVLVGVSCAVKDTDVRLEARRCVTEYRAAATAQDSLVVASKGCEWLLVPLEK